MSCHRIAVADGGGHGFELLRPRALQLDRPGLVGGEHLAVAGGGRGEYGLREVEAPAEGAGVVVPAAGSHVLVDDQDVRLDARRGCRTRPWYAG